MPIIVGGHAEGAARRAARYGDGFFPARGDRATLTTLLAVLREECAKIGRKPEEIELTTGGGFVTLDAVRRYQDLGVARLVIPPHGFDNDAITQGLHDFGDRVIAKL